MRPPLGGLPQLDPVPGTVAFVIVMIGTVTFDGLSQGQLWKDLAVQLDDGFDGARHQRSRRRPKLVADGRAAARRGARRRLLPRSASRARARSAATSSAERLRRAFIHTLVPIAMVYVAAHYLTFLLFEGQAIFYLASDPFGQGWDLFGTANSAIDYGLLSQNDAWYAAGRVRRASATSRR